MANSPSSSYDPIAEMYHKLWADWYLPAALPALEALFFSRVPTTAKVLDVCCGSGHVTRELIRRGYLVTGVDASAELVALAKRDWPQTDWRVQDVRALSVGSSTYDAALSTFDSFNHLSNTDDLYRVFRGLHDALRPGGLLVFDMNLEEAFLSDYKRWTAEVKEDYVSLVRGEYDVISKTASTELVWFVRADTSTLWQQHRSVVKQRSYTQAEIVDRLEQAGFHKIDTVAAANAGMNAELGLGRLFVSAMS